MIQIDAKLLVGAFIAAVVIFSLSTWVEHSERTACKEQGGRFEKWRCEK